MRPLSFSQIQSWGKCRYRWHLAYEVGLTAKRIKRPPTLGTLVHEGLRAAFVFNNIEAAVAAIELQCEELQRLLNNGEILVEDIDLDALEEDALRLTVKALEFLDIDRWETVHLPDKRPCVEIELEMPLAGWAAGFKGQLDWVAKDRGTGYIWLIDHKTRGTIQPADAEEVDVQKATYQRLLAYNGIRTVGTASFQILSKAPAIPKRNKDGSMSRSRVATDWETYRAALVAAGLNPADYQAEMEPKLDVRFFDLTKNFRHPKEVETIWQQIVVPAAKDLSRKDKLIYRTMDQWNCRGCDMRDICLADLHGHDTEYVQRTLYEMRS